MPVPCSAARRRLGSGPGQTLRVRRQRMLGRWTPERGQASCGPRTGSQCQKWKRTRHQLGHLSRLSLQRLSMLFSNPIANCQPFLRQTYCIAKEHRTVDGDALAFPWLSTAYQRSDNVALGRTETETSRLRTHFAHKHKGVSRRRDRWHHLCPCLVGQHPAIA